MIPFSQFITTLSNGTLVKDFPRTTDVGALRCPWTTVMRALDLCNLRLQSLPLPMRSGALFSTIQVSVYRLRYEIMLSLIVFSGGPGEPGIDTLLAAGEALLAYTDGHYDIVSWDPRGVGSRTVYVKSG
jgi:hypothetical protein